MRMCAENGIPAERDEFFMFEGMTGAATINELFLRTFGREATDEEKKSLYKRKTELFRAMPAVSRMPGASRLLEEMRERDVERVLVTGSGQMSLIDALEKDFPGAFSAGKMVSSRNVEHGKPHPEPYLRGLSLAGVDASEAIVVENAPLGVESGARAGILTIGVTTGPIPAQKLYDSGATVVMESMERLADAFPEIYMMFSER